MKICHVINDLSRGGAESHLYSLAKIQLEKGQEVSLLLLGRDLNNFASLEEQFNNLAIKILRLGGPKKLQGINPFSIFQGIRYFRNNNFDIIHTHSPRSDFLVYLSNLFVHSKSKRIVTIHGKYGTYLQGNYFIDSLRKIFIRQQSKIWQNANKVIVISESIKEWLFELNSSIKPIVINYGVEIPQFNIRRDLNNPTIGFLGKLNKNKGVEDLIKIYNEIDKEEESPITNLNLLIGGVGSEEYTKKIKNQVKSDNVKFLGYVVDRSKFFESIDLFLFPSYSEGLGLVLLEAMSYGILCITRDVSPMNNIIINNENGLLFKDNKELKDIIQFSINMSTSERERMIKSAYKTIENSYSIIQMYLSTEKAYS